MATHRLASSITTATEVATTVAMVIDIDWEKTGWVGKVGISIVGQPDKLPVYISQLQLTVSFACHRSLTHGHCPFIRDVQMLVGKLNQISLYKLGNCKQWATDVVMVTDFVAPFSWNFSGGGGTLKSDKAELLDVGWTTSDMQVRACMMCACE